jgi:predicted metal-binding protein
LTDSYSLTDPGESDIFDTIIPVRMVNYDGFVDLALSFGGHGAKIIDMSTIVTAEWVKMKCNFGCGYYGTNNCCPPSTPSVSHTREVLACYEHALLIHSQTGLRSEPHPTSVAVRMEYELFLSGFYKAFALGAGPCRLCEMCSLGNCRHPESARPSMESCGIDVFQTARNNGFSIETLTGRSCPTNRYALVLID